MTGNQVLNPINSCYPAATFVLLYISFKKALPSSSHDKRFTLSLGNTLCCNLLYNMVLPSKNVRDCNINYILIFNKGSFNKLNRFVADQTH